MEKKSKSWLEGGALNEKGMARKKISGEGEGETQKIRVLLSGLGEVQTGLDWGRFSHRTWIWNALHTVAKLAG